MAYSQMVDAPPADGETPGDETPAKPYDPTMPDDVEFEEGSAAHDGIERKIDNR